MDDLKTRIDALEGALFLMMRTAHDSDPMTGPMHLSGLAMLAEHNVGKPVEAEYRRLHARAKALLPG